MKTLKIRPAKESDKEEVLSFCKDTFNWGDYIHRVWDHWYNDRSGKLFVVESDDGRRIGVSHVSMCPGKKRVWLEGVRVHPDHRRSQIATRLVEKMLQYGRSKGAAAASAIISKENMASQRMMEQFGFSPASRWSYYSIANVADEESDARIATAKDFDNVWKYLQTSDIFQRSAKRYVKYWQWYELDRTALRNFVKERQVVVTGRRQISGFAIINKMGYWDRPYILQVVYLDAASKDSLRSVMSFVTNLCSSGGFERLQILCHQSIALPKFNIEESEDFILYDKVFTH